VLYTVFSTFSYSGSNTVSSRLSSQRHMSIMASHAWGHAALCWFRNR
jgi:hypothetical protein